MRMIRFAPVVLVPVDLPVDVTVVLEQQERAGEAKHIEHALRRVRCSHWAEHMFVQYERRRT
jgi:hypothetical protein